MPHGHARTNLEPSPPDEEEEAHTLRQPALLALFRNGYRPLTTALIATCLGASALMFTAPGFTPGELAVSLRWQIGWFALGSGCLCALSRRRGAALALGALAAWHVAPGFAIGSASEPPSPARDDLCVASANLSWHQDDPTVAERWLDAHREVDVLGLFEVSDVVRRRLDEHLATHHHRFYWPPDASLWHASTRGIAVLSRRPFEFYRYHNLDGDAVPMIEVQIAADPEDVLLRFLHAPRPTRPRPRRAVFRSLERRLTWPPTALLLGDFNVASDSPTLRSLRARTGLRDSRIGFGRLPSWNATPLLPGREACIDHAFAASGLEVTHRSVEDIAGSDHAAVVVRVRPRRAPRKAATSAMHPTTLPASGTARQRGR